MTNKNQNEFDGKLLTIPNDKYQKFFAKFDEIDKLDISEWRVAHLLGYFCRKYKETYNENYSWKFNNPSPTKCFEVWQMSVLASKLSANPTILKTYIDWAYETLVPKAKRRLTSISFMTKDEIIISYKMNVLLADKKNTNIDRSTALPDKYKKSFDTAGININSYGELAFLSQMEQTPEIKKAFEEIETLGFDKDILGRIV